MCHALYLLFGTHQKERSEVWCGQHFLVNFTFTQEPDEKGIYPAMEKDVGERVGDDESGDDNAKDESEDQEDNSEAPADSGSNQTLQHDRMESKNDE